MISENIKNKLNEQINKELFSAYLYLDFANYFEEQNLSGFSNWYNFQTKEELEHAMKIVKYLHDNNLNVYYEQIAKPEIKVENPLEIVKEALKHEEFITKSIEDIYSIAIEEKDYRTQTFLNWFISEQAEEETNARDIVDKVEKFGNAVQGLYILDREFAQRQ